MTRKERLRQHEATLRRYTESYLPFGLALKEVRDDRLYLEDGCKTFEAWCREKYDLNKRQAGRAIELAELRSALPDLNGEDKP